MPVRKNHSVVRYSDRMEATKILYGEKRAARR
jgi:hypothetical protein